jgi:hypothetical protein
MVDEGCDRLRCARHPFYPVLRLHLFKVRGQYTNLDSGFRESVDKAHRIFLSLRCGCRFGAGYHPLSEERVFLPLLLRVNTSYIYGHGDPRFRHLASPLAPFRDDVSWVRVLLGAGVLQPGVQSDKSELANLIRYLSLASL